MFVRRDERVPVSDDAGNVMYIKPKMDVKTRGRVTDSLAAISSLGAAGEDPEVALNLGSQNCVLLINNVVAWEGPEFVDEKGVRIPCTREWIERLDPDAPLVNKVLAEINARNVRPVSPDPNAPTASGSTSAGEPPSTGSA
jgi:hypothetical protein